MMLDSLFLEQHDSREVEAAAPWGPRLGATAVRVFASPSLQLADIADASNPMNLIEFACLWRQRCDMI